MTVVLKTVPETVRLLAQSIDDTGIFTGTREIRNRLITYGEMEPVWAKITDLARIDNELPIDFLYESAWLRGRWGRICKTPAGEIANSLKKIVESAESLALMIELNEEEIRFQTGLPLSTHDVLLRAYRSAEETEETEETTQNELYNELLRSYFRGPEFDVAELPVIPELLRAIAAEVNSTRALASHRVRPRKGRDPNAERTFIIRSLVEFFWDRFDEPCYDFAARTVNTILDLWANPIDAKYAETLSKDVR